MNKIKILIFFSIVAIAFSGAIVYAQNQPQAQLQAQLNRIQQQGITAKVSSINNSNIVITLGASEYTVDATNATIKKLAINSETNNMEETTINIADIKSGDTILIKGELNGQSISATEITVRNATNIQRNTNSATPADTKNNTATITGKITNISGAIIVMSDIRDSNLLYNINANGVGAQNISELKVGDMIEVSGNISIMAKTINLKNSGVRAGFMQQIGNFFGNLFRKNK